MSAEKLHAVTGALDAWEVTRVCLWDRINELLVARGTPARLREKGRELPTPPGGVTLAGALSALRVAARRLGTHLDVTGRFPWLTLGIYPLTLNGFPTAQGIEYDLQRLFTGRAADHVDADFWQDEIVAPTMKHAEDLRASLRAEKAKAAALVAATPSEPPQDAMRFEKLTAKQRELMRFLENRNGKEAPIHDAMKAAGKKPTSQRQRKSFIASIRRLNERLAVYYKDKEIKLDRCTKTIKLVEN